MRNFWFILLFMSVASVNGSTERTVVGLTESHVHKTEDESVESLFLKFMYGPCRIWPSQVASSLSDEAQIVLSKTKLLEKFKTTCSKEKVQSYFLRYSKKVNELEKTTADKLLKRVEKESKWLAQIPEVSESISVIGAVQTGARIDAFTKWGVDAYMANPEAFEKDLKRALNPKTSLFLKAFKQASELTINESALLSLVTHNHLAEQTLVMKIYALKGPVAAWNFLERLNEFYAMEREFWLSFNVLCYEDLHKTYGNDPSLLNACAASLPNSKMVPLRKSYHFWGALIAVNRLSETNLGVRLFPKAIFMKLGSFYKDSTSSKASEKAITLRVYEAAKSVWE
jgi:hypothetical protein